MMRVLIFAGAVALAGPAFAQDPHGIHPGMVPATRPVMDHGGPDGHAGHGDHDQRSGMVHNPPAPEAPARLVTVPRDGAMLMGSPARFEITFPHPMRLTTVTLQARGLEELRIDVAGAEPSTTQTVPLPTLRPATYSLTWRAEGPDGHDMTGTISFMVH